MTSRQAPTVRIRKVTEPSEPVTGSTDALADSAPSGSSDEDRSALASTVPPPPLRSPVMSPIPPVPAIPIFRADVVSPAELLSARLPDGYRVVQLAHEGQWSDVWQAIDEDGHPVAVKLARSRTPDIASRFVTEARALASLTHRSIVRLHAHGATADQRPFLALEWLEGPSLARTLEERGAGLPPVDAIRLLIPIANALLLAHDRGLVHGDLRAEHVILVPLPNDRLLPKLIDFAGALRIPAPAPKLASTEPSRPSPPSERSGPDGDPAVDVQAFAALVFHAIMGRPPFQPESQRTAREVPRSGLSERDAVLWRILAQGLAPPQVKRRQSLHDFAKALAQWADLRGVEADVTGSSILPRWSGSPPAPHRGPPRGG